MKRIFLPSLFLLLFFGGCFFQNSDPKMIDDSGSAPRILPKEEHRPLVDEEGFAILDDIPKTEEISSFPVLLSSTLPNDSQEVGGKLPITFSFNRTMDKQSVENAFALSPRVPGSFSWDEEGKSFTFTPEEEYSVGTTYETEITSDALDAEGNNLPEAIQKTFTRNDELKILTILPADGQEVETGTDVSIIFNQPIAELTTIDDLEKQTFDIAISPDFPHRFRLAGTSILQVQGQMPADTFPDGIELQEGELVEHRLPRSSEIAISVPDGFVTPNGLILAEGKTVTIRTPQIHLLTRGVETLHPFSPLRIAFDQPVFLSKFQSAFRMGGGILSDPSAVSVKYGIYEQDGEKKEDTSLIDARPPEDFWGYSERYRIWLESGVLGTEGTFKTEGSLVTDFSTLPFVHIEPEYSKFSTDSSSLVVGPSPKILLVFDMPPKNIEEVKSHLSISNVSEEDILLETALRCRDVEKRGWDEECEKESDPRRMTISLKNPLDNGKTYDIHFSEGLSYTVLPDDDRPELTIPEGWEGRVSTLKNPETISFVVAPKPQMIGAHAQKESYREICLFSETPIDAEKARDFLEITPTPLGEIELETVAVEKDQSQFPKEKNTLDQVYCQVPSYAGKYALRISGRLAFETEYRFLLKKGVPDVYGQEIFDAFLFSHTTGALKNEDIHIEPLSYDISVLPAEIRPVVVFRTMNVPEELSVDICALSPEVFFQQEPHFYSSSDWEPNSKDCLVLRTVPLSLPNRPWEEMYPEINLREVLGNDFRPGPYFLSATNPRFTETIFQGGLGAVLGPKEVPRHVVTLAQVTDLALFVKNDRKNVSASVFSLSTGEPVSSAEISGFSFEWNKDGTQKIHSEDFGKTDSQGTLTVSENGKQFDAFVATSSSGDAVFVRSDSSLSPQHYPLSGVPDRAYIFTDRPIYRPGDTVQGKAIFVKDDDAHYEPLSEKSISLQVYDARGNEIPIGESFRTDTLGSTSFAFHLASDVALGTGSLQLCTDTDACFSAPFQTEEYRKPEFSLEVTPKKDDVFSQETAKTDVSGEYYFGSPLSGGDLNVSLKRESYHFDRFTEEEGFVFGEEPVFLPYDSYDSQSKMFPPPFWNEPEQILQEKKTLDKNGQIILEHKIDLPFQEEKPSFPVSKGDDISLEPVHESKRYTYEVTAEDSNKNPIFSSASFIAHATRELVGIKPKSWSGKVGEENLFDMVVVDTNGKPLSQKSFRVFVVYERQEEDSSSSWGRRYHIAEEVVRDESLTTDEHGRSVFHFSPAEDMPGNYRIFAEITDERGEKQRSSVSFFVTQKDYVDLSRLEEQSIDLRADKSEYKVGDTAHISVVTPLRTETSTYFLSQERDILHSLQTFSGDEMGNAIDVKITEDMIPNIIISLTGHEFGDSPAIATGELSLAVSPEEKLLPIRLETDKESYLPGEIMHLSVVSEEGAEFAVIVTDKANLALFDSVRENIVSFFYGERMSFVQTLMSSLKIAQFPSKEKMISKTDGDAMFVRTEKAMAPSTAGASSMAFDEYAPSTPEGTPRSDFKDTAYFSAIVETDKNGKTELKIPLPDNLTTWNILVIGIDPKFRVGEEVKEITVSKPLLIRPQVPRFVRTGDTLFLRANVRNESESNQEVFVVLETENATAEKNATSISLPKGTEQEILFPIRVSGNPDKNLSVTITANSQSLRDSVHTEIPILAPSHPEAVATSGAVSEGIRTEGVRLSSDVLPNLGSLTISTSATIANYLESGLQSILSFSFSSAGSIADGVLGMVLYQEATSLPGFNGHLAEPKIFDAQGNHISLPNALSESISKLEKLQRFDGGWAYWEGSRETSPDLTVRVLAIYPILKRNNISFESSVPERAFSFLTSYYLQKQDLVETKGELENSYQADQRAVALFALSAFNPELSDILPLQEFLLEKDHQKLLSTSGKLALLQALLLRDVNHSAISELTDGLLAQLEIDPRGSFLASEGGWSPAGNSAPFLTASFLNALIAQEENGAKTAENPVLSRIVRWLLRSRKDGSWGDTSSTAMVLNALVAYLHSTKEYLADYEAKVIADGRVIQEYAMSSETLFDVHTVKIRTQDIVTHHEGLPIEFFKKTGEGTLYYEMLLKYFLPTAQILAREEGLGIRREYFHQGNNTQTESVSTAERGEVLRGEVTISTPVDRHLVAVEVPIPAGTEIVNFTLKTTDQRLNSENNPPIIPLSSEGTMGIGFSEKTPAFSGKMRPANPWQWGSPWTHTEIRDDRLVLYAEYLSPGVYTYSYFLRATHEGTFAHPPARAEEMDAPEIFGRTAGGLFEVTAPR